jgi:hypothetical protein
MITIAPYSNALFLFTELNNECSPENKSGIHSYIVKSEGNIVSIKPNEINTVDKTSFMDSFTVWNDGNDYVDFLEWLNQTLSI